MNMKLTVFLLALIYVCIVSADRTRKGRIGKRPFTVDLKDDKLRLYSKEKYTDIDAATEMKMYFTTHGFPRWRMEFKAKRKDEKSERKAKFRVGLVSVVEYNDTISIPESRSFVRFTGPLKTKRENLAWSKLTYPENYKEDPSGVYETSLTDKNDPDFEMTLRTFISSEEKYVEAAKTTVRDNAMKWGLSIENFDYQYEESSLALIAMVQSTKEAKEGKVDYENYEKDDKEKLRRRVLVDGDEDGISVDEDDETSLNWKRTFLADGVEAQVTGNIRAINKAGVQIYDDQETDPMDDDRDFNEKTGFVIFKFNAIQPSLIEWDPEVALNENTIVFGKQSSFPVVKTSAFVVVAGVLVVLAAVVIAKKRSSRV